MQEGDSFTPLMQTGHKLEEKKNKTLQSLKHVFMYFSPTPHRDFIVWLMKHVILNP